MLRSLVSRISRVAPAQARCISVINTTSAPAAVGPYSQAVSHGNFIFVSGQLPIDPATGKFAHDSDVAIQTSQSLKNMKAILEAGDSDMTRVLKTTILLADIKDFPVVNGVYAEFFPPTGRVPARATFAVKDLPLGARVEIECVATTDKE